MVVRAVSWPRDPAAVARSLARTEAWFWLDGAAADPQSRPGRSYLGAAVEVRHAQTGSEAEFLRALRHPTSAAEPGSGWVVALGYEFGVALLGEDPAADAVPPGVALRPGAVLVLDHATQRAELRADNEADLDCWLARHGAALSECALPSAACQPPASAATGSEPTGHNPQPSPRWHRSDARYLADVAACQAAIHAGEAYVLCLTDTATVAPVQLDPLPLYLQLRAADPAIRGAVIVVPQRALVSVSPERFLSKRGATIATHPIKGTRPRGRTPAQDMAFATELAADPKERAENLMIVDLMRNDLSRVCEPGSVQIRGFLRVEPHPRVHQLVSTVTGRLRPGLDVIDALQACFPGGSMTGAPKRRAVQLLAELEKAPRGLYSGCFGWLGDDGDAELAMSIRCVELRGEPGAGQLARIGAGGGITSDSRATAELAEKQLKAAALLHAVRAASAPVRTGI